MKRMGKKGLGRIMGRDWREGRQKGLDRRKGIGIGENDLKRIGEKVGNRVGEKVANGVGEKTVKRDWIEGR